MFHHNLTVTTKFERENIDEVVSVLQNFYELEKVKQNARLQDKGDQYRQGEIQQTVRHNSLLQDFKVGLA